MVSRLYSITNQSNTLEINNIPSVDSSLILPAIPWRRCLSSSSKTESHQYNSIQLTVATNLVHVNPICPTLTMMTTGVFPVRPP